MPRMYKKNVLVEFTYGAIVMLGTEPKTSPTVVIRFLCNSCPSMAVIASGTSWSPCSNFWAVTVTLSSVATSSANAGNASTARKPIRRHCCRLIAAAVRVWRAASSATRFGSDPIPVVIARARVLLRHSRGGDFRQRRCSQEDLPPRRSFHGFSRQPPEPHSLRSKRKRMTDTVSPQSHLSLPRQYGRRPPNRGPATGLLRYVQRPSPCADGAR